MSKRKDLQLSRDKTDKIQENTNWRVCEDGVLFDIEALKFQSSSRHASIIFELDLYIFGFLPRIAHPLVPSANKTLHILAQPIE